MTSNTSLLTRGDRLWATSQQKEENRAPWWGYNKRSAAGWYLGHPRKGEHQSDALTFQSTTIDNNSAPFENYQICLGKMRETSDGDCYYKVIASTIGDLVAAGLFPAIVNTRYLHAWPERFYFKLEKSIIGGIVN